MMILGIDPGSLIAGYGLIEKNKGQVFHVENGLIDCRKTKELSGRLLLLFEKITEVIEEYKPTVVAVENIFHAKNAQSALKLGQARGVLILAGMKAGLPVYEYTALQVKQAVAGYGHADKDQVQKMVKMLLKLPQVAEENASDALAVALCHAQSERLNRLMM